MRWLLIETDISMQVPVKLFNAFSANKEELWKLSGVNVTEQGTFALNGNTLYATLKSKAGLVAVDITNGTKKWNLSDNRR